MPTSSVFTCALCSRPSRPIRLEHEPAEDDKIETIKNEFETSVQELQDDHKTETFD